MLREQLLFLILKRVGRYIYSKQIQKIVAKIVVGGGIHKFKKYSLAINIHLYTIHIIPYTYTHPHTIPTQLIQKHK